MTTHVIFTIIEGLGLTIAVIDFLGLTQKVEFYFLRFKSILDSLNFGLDACYDKISYASEIIVPPYIKAFICSFGFSVAITLPIVLAGDVIYPGNIPRIFDYEIVMFLVIASIIPMTILMALPLLAIAFCQPFLMFAAFFNAVKLICFLFHYLSQPRVGIIGSIGLILAILSFVGQVYL